MRPPNKPYHRLQQPTMKFLLFAITAQHFAKLVNNTMGQEIILVSMGWSPRVHPPPTPQQFLLLSFLRKSQSTQQNLASGLPIVEVQEHATKLIIKASEETFNKLYYVNYFDKDLGNGKEMIYPYDIVWPCNKIHFIIVIVDSLNFENYLEK